MLAVKMMMKMNQEVLKKYLLKEELAQNIYSICRWRCMDSQKVGKWHAG